MAAMNRASVGSLERHALAAIDQAEGELRDAYRHVYSRVIGDFAPWSFETVRQLAGKSATKAPEWVQRLVGIMQKIAGNRISLVTGTLKERVKGILQGPIVEGALRDGFGIDKIVRLLREPMAEAYTADYLIERIARTEIIGSSNFASQAGAERAAEEFGLDMEKVWLSTPDNRTRDTHRAIHEQRRELGKPFNLPSGVALQFPGDPSVDAPGEIINCRCAVAHEPKD